MTFGEHLEELRRMLFRMILVAGICSIFLFYMKEEVFSLLLAPSEWDFVTYRWMERVVHFFGGDFHFNEFHVTLIATRLSSQFMAHLSASLCLGFLCTSPYMLYELFRFISPALYQSERKFFVPILGVVFLLFVLGMLVSYFLIFPIAFRFLGTYSVSSRVFSAITLDSYISTFATLTFVMGLVFQLPVLAYLLARMGLISADLLIKYRRHALLLIMLVSAIITPPDVITLLLVALPLQLLYEVSIRIIPH